MIKMVEKKKILLSMISIVLMIVLFGNVYVLATDDDSSGNTVTITATTNSNTTVGTDTEDDTEEETSNNISNNTSNNTSRNTSNNISNNISNNTSNNTSNNIVNNTSNSSSSYNSANSVTNSSKLPHTGTSSKVVLLVVVSAMSAIYAYKKVSDYNM